MTVLPNGKVLPAEKLLSRGTPEKNNHNGGRYIVKDIPAYLCGINLPTFRLFQHV